MLVIAQEVAVSGLGPRRDVTVSGGQIMEARVGSKLR